MDEREFIKGLKLSEVFFEEAVRPLMARRLPSLVYSAGLLGPGSDVLGFDTAQSMDHDWGPKLLLFLAEADYDVLAGSIDRALRQELPPGIHGYPTNFGQHEDGTRVMQPVAAGPINHGVTILTVARFFQATLHFDPAQEMQAVDWVCVPGHHLLMVTAGSIFHDGLGQLGPIRQRLHYYPDDVWLYLLAAQWRRIGQEEAFMGRCGQVGDDLGSQLVAGRLVRDLMYLCFLMERKYAPYIKWFGSAFARLECASELMPVLEHVLAARSWSERQTHLTTAYEHVARMHNALSITDPLPARVSRFHSRPFLVIHADRYVDAIRAQIGDKEVLVLPEHLGSVDQFIDSTDALNHLARLRVMCQ